MINWYDYEQGKDLLTVTLTDTINTITVTVANISFGPEQLGGMQMWALL